MTSLLLHWLNEELALHRKVHVLERDLCNGYILAEILHLHGLEGHLDKYADESDLSTRVTNLELLAKAMAAGGLGELKASTKREILMENRSAILQLLLHVKESLEARGKKVSVERQKLMNMQSRVYEPRSPVKDPARVIQDVEERFVKETHKQYQPTEVRFYKDVDNAVYLRKFPQRQWQAENEQIEYEDKMAAEKAQQNANGRGALRAHMKEKRVFMKEWDKQRLEKWQHTQKLYMDAERDDLRLELTLEERKRRFQAAKLAKIQVDANDGVVGFEKNMNRLGLGGNNGAATDPRLRAIPASDPGALAHFHRLEERVEDLSFRPSNNVQMMKELRARRKAQLAAEKDRRLRRMKAVSDANKAAAEAGVVKDTLESTQLIEGVISFSSMNEDQKEDVAQVKPIHMQEAFIETNRDALEANYTRIREIGATKREADFAELHRIRLDKRSKTYQRSKADCLEIVDDLVAFAIAAADYDPSGDDEALREWKRSMWSEQTASKQQITAVDVSYESEEEVRNMADGFLGLSDMWESFVDQSDEASSPRRLPTSSLSSRVDSFVRSALVASPDELLSTSWTPLASFRLVSVYSTDDRGHAVARRVADDQSLHYVNVDELLDECVKCSYDPVKQADVAATLSDRERELGAFGLKISTLRQKNTPIPDSLTVDVVFAAISLCQPKVSAPSELNAGDEGVFSPEELDQAPVPGSTISADRVGCLLHNFPRTAEEWKLFERLCGTTSRSEGDEEAKSARAAALEAAQTADAGQYASNISVAIVISHLQPPEPTPTPTPVLSPSSSGSELPTSAGEKKRAAESNIKRQVTVDPAIAKAEAELEALQKRQLVEELFSKTSRIVKIDQTEMHERVLQQLVHLAVDVFSCESASEQIGLAIECSSCVNLPDALHNARESRRATMPLIVRIAWMVATKEITLREPSLMELVLRLQHLEDARATNLRRLFSVAHEILKKITHATRTKQQELDELLGHIATQCEVTLEKAGKLRHSKPRAFEKALTAVEVELGDAIDHSRILAKRFIEEVEEEAKVESPCRVSLLAPWFQLLPRVCLELKEFVIDVSALLRSDLYSHFPFLQSEAAQVLPLQRQSQVLEAIAAAVESIDRSCAQNGLYFSFLPEISRLVGQIVPANTTPTDVSTCSTSYDLAEDVVASELATLALQRIEVVLRWSASLVNTVRSTYASDVESMRGYVSWELDSSNRVVARAIKQLAKAGTAQWPRLPSESDSPTTTLRPRVSRHHQAAFLSVAQLEALVAELWLAEEAFASQSNSLENVAFTREQFVVTLLGVATRDGFPEVWQDAKSLARVAMAWSDGSQACRVPWRQVIFAIIYTQFTGFPTIQDLHNIVDRLGNHTEPLADQTITRDDFHSHHAQWFEHGQSSPNDAARWKSLLFSLFTDKSYSREASMLRLVLTCCTSPASPWEIRSDLASTVLPRYARGLSRAFAVVSRWLQVTGSPGVGVAELTQLLRFAEMNVDTERLTKSVATHRSSSDGDLRPWRAHETSDFLRFCDAFDPAIAQRFVARDVFSALVDEVIL